MKCFTDEAVNLEGSTKGLLIKNHPTLVVGEA